MLQRSITCKPFAAVIKNHTDNVFGGEQQEQKDPKKGSFERHYFGDICPSCSIPLKSVKSIASTLLQCEGTLPTLYI